MPVEGAVDAVLGRFVVGWAHDPEESARRVDLELELDGELVGAATANLERGDLVMARIGDGCHAFRFELPRGFEPGSEHQLAVRARGDGHVLPLAHDFQVEFEPGRSGADVVVSVPAKPVIEDIAPPPDPEPAVLGPARALLGRQGWRYELRDLELLECVLGARRLSDEQIGRARERLLESHRRLRELGTVYVAVVLPAKENLYPDHLPPQLEPSPEDRAAALVSAALRDENGLELLDLLPALRDARRHGELVPPAGVELTWIGAFHAYRALAKDLAKRWPAIEPLALSALTLGPEIPIGASPAASQPFVLVDGDAYPVVTDAAGMPTEPDLVGEGLGATFVAVPPALEERLGPRASRLEAVDPDVSGTALVVHRGAGARVTSLLAEHFGQTLVAVSDEVPYEAAQSEGAVVVIHLVDEVGLCE